MDIANIDDGSALEKAIEGDLSKLLKILRDKTGEKELSVKTRQWIADRIEGKEGGKQKRGPKPDVEEVYLEYEMYFHYFWLVEIEGLKKKTVEGLLSKIYSGKPDTIRRDIGRLKRDGCRLSALKLMALGISYDEKAFLETRDNKYRPHALQNLAPEIDKMARISRKTNASNN